MQNDKVFRELNNGEHLQNGRYIIEGVVGSGGFGITYKARHSTLNTIVAIKEFFINGYCVRGTGGRTIALQNISEEVFVKYRLKFVEEAQTLAQLSHSNIISVSDVFDENDTSYFVMPYINGFTLQHLVEEKGALKYDDAVNYIGQLTEAIGYLHERKILHRDIKPENIIITPENRVVLIDFGSAREFVHDKTQSHTSILTKGYAPLEQYSNTSRKGSYTDIYALGAVFYFALTRVKPMDATERTLEKMAEPKALNSSIPTQANNTIVKAMEMIPTNRYQTIEEFRRDLLRVPEKLREEKDKIDIPNHPNNRYPENGVTKPSRKKYPEIIIVGAILLITFFIVLKPLYIDRRDFNEAKFYNSAYSYMNYLSFHGGGWYVDEANQLLWEVLSSNRNIGEVKEYMEYYAKGSSYYQKANKLFKELKDENDFAAAQHANTVSAYQDYISKYPNGRFVMDAQKRTLELLNKLNDESDFAAAQRANTVSAYQNYISLNPNGLYVEESQKRITALQPSVTFKNIIVDHNYFLSDKKGMNINIQFSANNLLGKEIKPTIYFYKEDGTPLEDTDGYYATKDNKVAASNGTVTPRYENSLYEKFFIFMPYNELHINTNYRKVSCYFDIVFWCNGEEVGRVNKAALFVYN